MRQNFVAGNWKMNLDLDSAVALVRGLKEQAGDLTDVTMGVFPPFVYLKSVADELAGSNIIVGAQNMYTEPEGAFTAEISPGMIKDVGCTHVILGHSERRHVFGESDALINEKVMVALDNGLKPILCVGETREEREANRTWEVIEGQLTHGLEGLDAAATAALVIAYEPVWAIGTGLTATPDQAQDVHAQIRAWLATRFDASVAGAMRILYGGSVSPKTVDGLMAMEDVDGGLVGGASLKVEDFTRIVRFEQT